MGISKGPDTDFAKRARTWQTSALKSWENHDLHGVVRVVTGGGKTVFAELCMISFLERFPNAGFVIVVPTHALLDQWHVGLCEDLGFNGSEISVFPDTPPSVANTINLAVINSARRQQSFKKMPRPSMLIVDECHRAGSPKNAEALSGEYRASLGLSATPERDYDEGFAERVAPALGEIIFDYSINDARHDGVVSAFSLINVLIPLLPDEEQEYDKLSLKIRLAAVDARGENEDRIKRLLQQRARVAGCASFRVPMTARILDEHRGQRCLVFHENIQQAEMIYKTLLARGHAVALYHSHLSQGERYDSLRQFRRGVFDVLVSCRALDEGVNVPEACVAVIASATASSRQRIQRLGRVLRPAPGKVGAVIYSLYTSKSEEIRLRSESLQLTAAESIEWRQAKRASNAKTVD